MVWKRAVSFVFLLVLSTIAYAQTTAVSLTGVTDSDTTVWANGTWKLDFNPNPNYPGEGQYFQGSSHLSGNVTHQSGNLDSSGNASFTTYDSSTITPVGSGWKLSVCPKASAPCGIYTFSTAGATMNITSNVNAILPAPRFVATLGAYGYADVEAITTNLPGAFYFNTNLACLRIYTGSSFACASAGAAVPAGPSFALNFANSGVTGFQGDPSLTINTSTKNLTAQQVNNARNAASYQTGGGNNGIANALVNGAYVIADPAYSGTEAQPWGGANGFLYPPQLTGPKGSDANALFLDTRFGVPQWVYNNGALFDNRHTYWPSFTSNYTGGLTGLFQIAAGALGINSNYWTGGHNFYNDKTEFGSIAMNQQKYSEGQNGAGIQSTAYCYAFGDCVGYAADQITRGGGTLSDEMTEIFRLHSFQSTQIFTGTVASVSVSNTINTITTSSQVNTNVLASNLPILVTSPAKVYNTGYISSISYTGGNIVATCSGCNLDGTFGIATQTNLTSAIQNPGSTNSFPQTNAVISVTSTTGFVVGKNACIWDYDWDCAQVTNINAGANQVTLAYIGRPHPNGSLVTTGGLGDGRGIEFEYDRKLNGDLIQISADAPAVTAPLKQVFPIVANLSGNKVILFQGINDLPGGGGAYTGRAYQTMGGSGGTCTPTISGGAVTSVAVSGGSGYISSQNPPQITFSGSWTTSPSAYITKVSSGAVAGAAMISGGTGVTSATCSIAASNPYDIYQIAKVTEVYNLSTGAIDGTIKTEPFTASLSNGDTLEQPDSHQQHVVVFGPTEANQLFPTLNHSARSGIAAVISGLLQGNDKVFDVASTSNPLLFSGYPAGTPGIGGRGQLTPPDYMFVSAGAYRRMLYSWIPPFAPNLGYNPALTWADCGFNNDCSIWTSPYYLAGGNTINGPAGWQIIPATGTVTAQATNLDLSQVLNLSFGFRGFTSNSGLVAQQGQNWNPYSNDFSQPSWTCSSGVTIVNDTSFTDPFKGNQNLGKMVVTGANGGCSDTTSTTVPNLAVSGSVWVYTTVSQVICVNASNSSTDGPTGNGCWTPPINQWTRLTATASSPVVNTVGTGLFLPNGAGTIWIFNPVMESGKTVSASAVQNPTASSITTDITVNQFQEPVEMVQKITIDGDSQAPGDTCNAHSSRLVNEAYVASCASAGGSMVWPTGAAGVPNYSGSSSWGTTYNASNPIPASFLSVTPGINQITGDLNAGPGPGSVTGTLATVNGAPGTCGDSTHVCAVTINGKGLTTGQTATAIAFPAGIANIQISIGSFAIPANTCYGSTGSTTPATATMTGLTTTSAPFASYNGNPSAITGWGTTGGLSLQMWPTSNTLNYLVCNATSSSITGGAITFNVGAR